MFELLIKGKLIVPHLRCKTSFTLVTLPLRLSVLVVNPLGANSTKWSNTLKEFVGNSLNQTQIHNFHNFLQTFPD